MDQSITFYVANLEVLRAAVAARPEDEIHLDSFAEEHAGKFRYCAVRLICQLAHFHVLGVKPAIRFDHGPVMDGPRGHEWSMIQTVNHLFGMIADHEPWDVLFAPYGDGVRDGDLIDCLGAAPTHKALALARLDLALEILTGEFSQHSGWLSRDAVRQAVARSLAACGWQPLCAPVWAKVYAAEIGDGEALAYLSGPDPYNFRLSATFDSEGANALAAEFILIPRTACLDQVDALVRRFAALVDKRLAQTHAASLLRRRMSPERLAEGALFYALNVDVLIDAVRDLPDAAVYLDAYAQIGEEGAQVCLGGVVAKLPAFAAYGVASYGGAPRMWGANGALMSAEDTLNNLFGGAGAYGTAGETAFRALFAPRWRGLWDEALGEWFGRRHSDKELGLARLYLARELLTGIPAPADFAPLASSSDAASPFDWPAQQECAPVR